MSFGFKSLLLTYCRLVIIAGAVLLGIQVPSFVEQYQQRVDAHFLEVSANISGFRTTANLLFGGDLQQLIAYYANSNDPVFQRDANSIQLIVDRYDRMAAEQAAMQGNLLAVAWHVMFVADPELFNETLDRYSYTVPLNALAVQWGLALAVVLTLTLDGLLFGCSKCIRYLRHRNRKQHNYVPHSHNNNT